MLHLFAAFTVPVLAGALPPGEPIRSLGVQGRYVTVNGQPAFLVGQMTYEFAYGRTLDEVGEMVDVMMVPFGMNLIIGDSGVIYWGAWNNRENVRKGREAAYRPHQYAWKRTGGMRQRSEVRASTSTGSTRDTSMGWPSGSSCSTNGVSCRWWASSASTH